MMRVWRPATRAAALRSALTLPLVVGCASGAARHAGSRADGCTAPSRTEGHRVDRVEEPLAWCIPGLDVRRMGGGQYRLRLRDAGAVGRSGDPLYVVNGVPLGVGVPLDVINPDDVVSVSVLRGAVASVDGTSGRHGVIAITLRPARP